LLQSKKKSTDMIFRILWTSHPPVAEGGKGVVVSGCPICKKRINTMTQFLDHLTNDVMPAVD